MDKFDNYYRFCDNKDWQNALLELLNFLEEESNSFWFNTSLSSIYYELREYDTALLYAEKAYKLNPKSPLVMWDYAVVLLMVDKKQKAIKLWKRILSLEENEIAFNLTSEGLKWARALRNDCYYRIGQAYYYLGQDKLANEYIQTHLSHRKKGQMSIYTKKEVIKFLNKISNS